jgi:hypothetical protein
MITDATRGYKYMSKEKEDRNKQDTQRRLIRDCKNFGRTDMTLRAVD